MTREEYIKDLVSQNITGREIVELASQFNEEEEEVKTDDVVAQDATVTSTNQEASESSDGTSLSEEEKATTAAELASAKQLVEDSLFDQETIDKYAIESQEIYNQLNQDISGLTTRKEEGEAIAKKALEDIEGQDADSDFKTPEALKNFFEPGQQMLADLGGFAYEVGTSVKDFFEKNPMGPGSLGDFSEKEEISTVIEGKKIVKDSKEVKDFNLIKETEQTAARDYLFQEGNKNPSDQEVLKYIANNSQKEDFQNTSRKIFQDKYIKQRQKEAIIERNKKESGWDGFSEGENQNRLEEAAALISSSLDKEAQSNIATSASIDSKIQNVEEQLMALKKLKPTSQEEANLIISKASVLFKERQGLVDAYGDLVNRQIEIGTEAKDIRGYLDTVSRNQGWLVNPVGALVGGVYDFVDGVDEFIDRMVYSPFEMAADVIKVNTNKDSWLHESVLAMEGLEKTNFSIDTAINNMREGLAEPISVSDIDNWSDMWQWSSHLVGSQAANTAVMLTTGGWALPLLGASSSGASFNSMQQDIDLYGEEITPLQMYTVALGTGLAEGLSERITLGQLNRIKKGLRASGKNSLKQGTEDYIRNLFTKKGATRAATKGFVYGKETFEEGFTEAVAGFSQRALERYVLGKDVGLFDGMKDEFISGAFMSGFVYKAPGLGMRMYKAFQPEDSNQTIGKLKTRNIEIGKILENSPLLDIKVREKLENELQENTTKVQQIMAKDFRNMDKMSQEEQNDLMAKEDKIYNLRELYDTTLNDNNINEKDRESILSSLSSELRSIKNDKLKLLSEVNVREEISLAKKIGEETGRTDFGEDAVGTGQAVEVVEDDAAFKEMTKIDETGVEGVELKSGQIVLNKAQMLAAAMRNGGNIGTGIHEILHKVLKSEFSSKDPDKAEKLKKQFLKILKSENRSVYDKVIARIEANYDAEYLAKNPDEYITTFASVLKENNIEYSQATDGLFTKLANFISGLFSDKLQVDPNDFKFKDGKDLYNFVQTYVKNTSEGKVSERTIKLAEAGKDVKVGDKLSRSSVLEEINKLVPQDIVTKEEYDAFLADPRANKPLFDALLLEGGVINNYVRSRTTTKAEADKAIESLTDRIMNFNPEAKRADGKPVGMQGFGEAIFANTRFAKLDAKKALFKEGEKAKQQKSIDGGTLQIADESTTSKKDDTKLAKKPSETTVFDKDTEARIDEAVNKNFKGPDVKFSETRDVPNDVAVIYAEKLGINPQTITDKTKNYTKKDAEGLTKAKQLLLKNAKDDYARLPKLKDDFGKGTFVPKNVKDALYTDGELTGSLKDYMDLIREKPVKPIYRDRVGQTIRGLLNLTIRNRILETAQPLQAKRIQSGAKFSKSLVEVGQLSNMQQVLDAIPGENGEMVLNQKTRPNAIIQFLKAIVKGKIPSGVLLLSHMQNFAAERARVGERSQDKRLLKWANKNNIKLNKKSVYYLLTNGNYMEVSKVGKIFPQPTILEIEKNKFGGKDITLVPAKGGMFYGKKDPNYIEALRLAKENDVLYPNQVQLFKNAKRVKIKDQQRIDKDFVKNNKSQFEDNKKARNAYFDIIYSGLEENNLSLLEASWMLRGAYAATDGIIKISAEFIGTSTEFTLSPSTQAKKDEGKKIKETTEEHSPPASTIGGSILAVMEESIRLKDKSLFENAKKAIDNNFFQTQIAESVDFNLNKNKLGDKIVKGTSILTPNVGWVRLAAGKANLNKIFLPLIEKNAADLLGYSLTKKQGNNQNNVEIQNKEIIDNAVYLDVKFSKSVNRLNVFADNLGDSKLKTGKNNVGIFGFNKINTDMTVSEQIKVLNDYDKTLKFSRSLKTKPKGISVFDFDDTLAKTKEKVIVNKADGTTIEISAAKFAEQASELQENGATFNFDNFENVGKGTQKGPLADLALRRQGKFGSKDIFVLTARPQIAATDIKMFLDGIGLNLPIENITGLEDGSPQAKATWVISKTAEGYNDFYFADDAIKNVKAVKEILDQVDVKSKVQQAKYSKSQTFDKVINNILEDSTGIKSEAEFSKARAQTVGAKKGRFSFFVTPSAEDFVGLIYKFLGKGKVGDAQFQFFKDNLIDPYNRAELAVTRAKISAANDFKKLKKSLKTLPKSLSKQTGIGGFTFGQAARVAVWTRQGMEVPGLSKKDAKELNAFIDNNAELDVFVDELINIQKGKPYPAPSQTWLAGNITSDIVNEINKVNRKEYMQEFNENVDIIFSDKVMNKLEAAYGPRYVEALRDQLRRMKSGSNRPIGNSRIVDQLLNWLNNSVGAIMFLNTRSAVLQTISAVNFINFGNNNLIAAGKALLNQKQYWKDFMTLMNSPYLVERRDGLKINVSESEIADAVSESSNKPKAFLNLLLSKGFILTRIADSFAIAAGGATFYRNQIKAYMKSGMDQAAAEKQAFDDFYAIAEESQQSSNPSKISQQQASGAGRVILAFANTPMQYARIIKRATQDLINGRGDWKTNVSKIVYYSTIQNLIFNALSNALFALAFSEEDEEKEDKTGRIANGMADSLLRGLGIQGAAVAAVKDALLTIYKQANKEKGAPEFRKAISDLFGFSPPLDSKIRKLTSGANTLSWEREKMSQEGFNLNNPAYLAFAQVLAGLTNVPLDRAIQKINNLRAATSDSSAKWQKVALLMGWSTWDLGLPYYGVEDKVEMTPQMILKQKVDVMKKETNTKEQKETLLKLGLTKQQIKALKYEDARVKKIIELQNK